MVPAAMCPNDVRRAAACRASRHQSHRRPLIVASWLVMWLCLLGALAAAPRAADGMARPAALDETFEGARIFDIVTSSGLPNMSVAGSITDPSSASDQWMATYGGLLDDSMSSVAPTHDGGFVVAGNTDSFGADGADVWVLKLNTDGSIVWQKTYGEPGSDETASFVREAQDGSLYVVGNIALDGANTGRIYGVTRTFNAGQTSPDGGHTWVPWASIPPSVCVQLLAHPTTTNILFLRCEAGLYRSLDGGNSWTQITHIQGDALAPNLGVPGQLLWSHSGCLWASGDTGTTWTRVGCFSRNQNSRFVPIVMR